MALFADSVLAELLTLERWREILSMRRNTVDDGPHPPRPIREDIAAKEDWRAGRLDSGDAYDEPPSIRTTVPVIAPVLSEAKGGDIADVG